MKLLTEMNEVGFFEGTEKLLEIWFENDIYPNEGDLRKIPRSELDGLLKIVNAEIVSTTNNEYIDSYVLSESSMFISKDRFIIKTCGITKLLYAVKPIIKLAKQYGKMNIVHNFFYSRRIYLRPEEQVGFHKSFREEVKFLDSIIPDGSAYVLGQQESDQWYLFTMDNVSKGIEKDDVTLEILMSELDEEAMTQFSKSKYETSQEVVMNTGISRIIPGSLNDGILFDPIGYSLNGLHKDSYYTIHVTPQPMCSYVSFETNIKLKNYNKLVNRVLNVFKPGSFVITLFSNKSAPCGISTQAMERVCAHGYRCDDQHHKLLKNYTLSYAHFVKKDELI